MKFQEAQAPERPPCCRGIGGFYVFPHFSQQKNFKSPVFLHDMQKTYHSAIEYQDGPVGIIWNSFFSRILKESDCFHC